jgi:2-iminobutanoate/2-iminopropanoate deaminase
MDRQCINVPGRITYPISSHVVRAGGFAFTTGTLGTDPESGQLVATDIKGQARQELENIKHALDAAGTSMDNVVKVTCYFLSIEDKAALNEVYADYFRAGMPARAGIGAAALPPGALIEMDAVAVIPD